MATTREINDLPAIVFPHSYLAQSSITAILSFFGPLTVFQPWFMEKPEIFSEGETVSLIKVVNPPADLKPGEQFGGILSEYRNWIRANPDKAYTSFLQVSQAGLDNGETTWDIRKAIRSGQERESVSPEDSCFKWHLILHLAREVQEQREDADRLLRLLKKKDSPLKGIVEGEAPENLFHDLPQFGAEPMVQDSDLEQIYEAWFSLFGCYLKDHELLVTTSPQVVKHVWELWQEYGWEGKDSAQLTVTINVPDLSLYELKDIAGIKEEMFGAEKLLELRKSIREISRAPRQSFLLLRELSEKKLFPKEKMEHSLKLTIKYMQSKSSPRPSPKNKLLSYFSGKTIALVEGEES